MIMKHIEATFRSSILFWFCDSINDGYLVTVIVLMFGFSKSTKEKTKVNNNIYHITNNCILSPRDTAIA